MKHVEYPATCSRVFFWQDWDLLKVGEASDLHLGNVWERQRTPENRACSVVRDNNVL